MEDSRASNERTSAASIWPWPSVWREIARTVAKKVFHPMVQFTDETLCRRSASFRAEMSCAIFDAPMITP